MKEKFTISITHSSGAVLHNAVVGAEDSAQLASQLRRVANVIKDVDFDGLGSAKVTPLSRAGIGG